MGDGDEQNMIVKALWSSFLRAHERGWKSVSFPGVSSGIFSVPHDICARGYLQAVEKFYSDFPDSQVSLLRLVLFEGPLLDAVRQALPD
jgi:O-acetyl-ADP-ribose deacetylase (regulator of RNase III)